MSDFVEQWVELSENKFKWWKQIVLGLFIETVIIFWYILSTEWGVVLYFFFYFYDKTPWTRKLTMKGFILGLMIQVLESVVIMGESMASRR